MQRRWSDFRQGHNTYLTYFLSFMNFSILVFEFVLIQLAVYFPILLQIFPTLVHFFVIFIVCYFPVAAIIGWLHRRYQMPIDVSLSMKQNPYWREIVRSLADFERALLLMAKDDKEQAAEMLSKAIKRLEMDFA